MIDGVRLGCLLLVSHLLGALAATPAQARELWSAGDFSLEWTGMIRDLLTVAEATRQSDFEDAFATDPVCADGTDIAFANCAAFATVGATTAVQNLTRIRNRIDLHWKSKWSATVVYDHEILAGDIDTFNRALALGFVRETLLGAEQTIATGEHVEWRHLLYRAFIRYEGKHVDITIGRQRIAWGVGRLWNPIDRFNPIGPLAIQGDQSLGIDAVDVRWRISGFDYLEFVYAPGRGDADERAALRYHGVVRDTDLSLVVGVLERGPFVGFDVARNLADAAVRLEAVWTDPRSVVQPIGTAGPEPVEDYWQIVASVDLNIAIGSGLYLLAEHLYNGNALGFGTGLAGPLLPLFTVSPSGAAEPSIDVFGKSQVVSNAKHQTGLQLGYDLLPELRLDVVTIYDWNGHSAVFFPALRYSPLGSIELSIGVQVGVGKHLSQYGNLGTLGFAQLDFFF